MTAILPLLDPGRFPTNCVEPWERMRKHRAASKAIPGRERKKKEGGMRGWRAGGGENRGSPSPGTLCADWLVKPGATLLLWGWRVVLGSGVLGESGRTSP